MLTGDVDAGADDDTLSAALAHDVAASSALTGSASGAPVAPPSPLADAMTGAPTGASEQAASRRAAPAPVTAYDLFSTTEMSATQ